MGIKIAKTMILSAERFAINSPMHVRVIKIGLILFIICLENIRQGKNVAYAVKWLTTSGMVDRSCTRDKTE